MRRLLVPTVALPLSLLAAPKAAQSASRVEVACRSGSGAQTRNRVVPRTCTFLARGTDPADAANRLPMQSLRWKAWGASATTGTGLTVSPAGDRERATVRLFGRITCGGGRYYTRARLTYRDAGLQRKYRPSPMKLQAGAG